MMNTAFLVLSLVLNLALYWTLATWYVKPWLSRRSVADALALLSLVHGFRTMGTVFMIPGVIGSTLPADFSVPGVVGDLLAAALGIAAAIALRTRSAWALPLSWLLIVEGLLDFTLALGSGMRIDLVAKYAVGPAWFIPTFMVPFFTTAHLLAIGELTTRGSELRAWRHIGRPAVGAA